VLQLDHWERLLELDDTNGPLAELGADVRARAAELDGRAIERAIIDAQLILRSARRYPDDGALTGLNPAALETPSESHRPRSTFPQLSDCQAGSTAYWRR
jgi:hypothetical protein